MNLLNIGCGGHFHEAWTNVDLVSTSPHVRAYDLRKGLPYTTGSFDACYTSHVLEHLAPDHARASVQEQFRVLRSGGIIRTVVPDLEDKAREYLATLEAVTGGIIGAEASVKANSEANYDWMVFELLDQTVRTKVGGAMGAYLLNPAIPNAQYIIDRLGDEAEDWLNLAHGNVAQQSLITKIFGKILSKKLPFLVQKARLKTAELAVSIIAGSEAKSAFTEGVFRNSGEIHRWMYDRFSLGRLLREAGFTDIRVCAFNESRIPEFTSYLLDGTPEGRIRKADSLFMEAVKP